MGRGLCCVSRVQPLYCTSKVYIIMILNRKLISIIAVLIFWCNIFLFSCSPPTGSVVISQTNTATKTIPPTFKHLTVTPSHTLTFQPSKTVTPSSTSPTRLACWKTGGRVDKTNLRDSRLRLPMEVRIYLPPCYNQETQRRYPVLYLMHGQNFTEDQWERLGAAKTANHLIANQQSPPFIIVMPRDRLWTSPRESPFGVVFIETLIPYIDQTFRTKTSREQRAIGGLSRGGAWAMYLGISSWEYFGAIGSHSSFYFYGEEYHTKRWFAQIPPDSIPRIFVDIGRDDFLKKPNFQLEEMLIEHNVPHEWYIYPGRHEETYWQSHIEQYFLWYTFSW